MSASICPPLLTLCASLLPLPYPATATIRTTYQTSIKSPSDHTRGKPPIEPFFCPSCWPSPWHVFGKWMCLAITIPQVHSSRKRRLHMAIAHHITDPFPLLPQSSVHRSITSVWLPSTTLIQIVLHSPIDACGTALVLDASPLAWLTPSLTFPFAVQFSS